MASSSQAVAPGPQCRLESKDLPSIRCLGKGLSGIIYETEWLGNRYSRKDFPLGSMKHNHVFEKEAKSLFDLDHPNIVKCFGYTVGKSSCSLLQEYVDDNLQNTMEKRIEAQRNKLGSDSPPQSRVLDIEEIKRLISRKVQETGETDVSSRIQETTTPFELPEAVDIILQIATGMEYLHDHGIAHGDLKPNNVLLYWESGVMKVKVADFGLIETKKRIKMVSKRARHMEILMWKAPERLEKLLGSLTENSNDPFTESDTNSDESGSYENFKKCRLAMADVYSFGLTCLHILGEELKYPDLSLTQLREKRTSPGFRHKLPSACPEYLEILIHSVLEFEFSRRPTFSYIRTLLEKFHLKHIPHVSEENEKMKNSLKVEEMEKDGQVSGGMRNNGLEINETLKKSGQVIRGMKSDGSAIQRMQKDGLVLGVMEKDGPVLEGMKKNHSQVVEGMKKDGLQVDWMKRDGQLFGEMEETISLQQLLNKPPHVGKNLNVTIQGEGKRKENHLQKPLFNMLQNVERNQGLDVDKKISKGVHIHPHSSKENLKLEKKKERSWQSGGLSGRSIEGENIYQRKYKNKDLIEEENSSERLDDMEDLDSKMRPYLEESHAYKHVKAPHSRPLMRQQKINAHDESTPLKQQRMKISKRIENPIHCGGLLPHKSSRGKKKYIVSNPAWKDKMIWFQEQHEPELKEMKEQYEVECKQVKEMILDFLENFQEFKSKRWVQV